MRIDQLYYLVILSESSSIIEASEKLHLSHQVLGNFLKKTEEEFNVKIFKRSKKGIEITKNGQEIIEFAKETLEKYNKVCKKENNILKREIILYTTLIYTISVLPYIINYFPQMQIALYN